MSGTFFCSLHSSIVWGGDYVAEQGETMALYSSASRTRAYARSALSPGDVRGWQNFPCSTTIGRTQSLLPGARRFAGLWLSTKLELGWGLCERFLYKPPGAESRPTPIWPVPARPLRQ